MINLPDILDNQHDITLPVVRERTSSIIAYRVILVSILKEINAEVRRSIIPKYSADLRYVADRASWFVALKAIASRASEVAASKASELFRKESESHLKRFVQSVKRGTGIDVSVFFHAEGNKSLIETYIDNNTSLINSLSDEAVRRVEQAVYRAKLQKQTANELKEELMHQLGLSKTRAELIAVDQLSSINADLNEARQRAAGIDDYKWVGKKDKRERKLHLNLEGRTYKWGEKTGAEGGLPPGKPIRCRCVAQAVIPARKSA